MPVRVGIVDSGVAPALHMELAASVAINAWSDGGAMRSRAIDDPVGHGTAVAMIVLAQTPLARLLSAQVFGTARRADSACVAEAIAWCMERRARIINLSLGLAADHDALRAACAAAVAGGAIVVASSPARGAGVYPAAYPGVIAVSGDARCGLQEWSIIEPGHLYGAPPLGADGVTPGGASFAAARVSGHAARFLETWPDAGAADFRAWLTRGAAFHGRERRTAEAAA